LISSHSLGFKERGTFKFSQVKLTIITRMKHGCGCLYAIYSGSKLSPQAINLIHPRYTNSNIDTCLNIGLLYWYYLCELCFKYRLGGPNSQCRL